MGVLVEALSVIVPVARIEALYTGGLAKYEADCPNATYCSDGHITRIGFMAPPDVKDFVDRLRSYGLSFQNEGEFVDIAVVDQLTGLTARCSWLKVARHPLGFTVAWLQGTTARPMVAPKGWTVEQSSGLQFISNDEASERTLPLMREGQMDVVLDFKTGKELYVGRTTRDKSLILPEE